MRHAIFLDDQDLATLLHFINGEPGFISMDAVDQAQAALADAVPLPDIRPALEDRPAWFSLSVVPTPAGDAETDRTQLMRMLAAAAMDGAYRHVLGGDPHPMTITVNFLGLPPVTVTIGSQEISEYAAGIRGDLARVPFVEVSEEPGKSVEILRGLQDDKNAK